MKLILTTATEGMPAEMRAQCPNAGCLFIADTAADDVPAAEVVRLWRTRCRRRGELGPAHLRSGFARTAIMSTTTDRPSTPTPGTNAFDAAGGRFGS